MATLTREQVESGTRIYEKMHEKMRQKTLEYRNSRMTREQAESEMREQVAGEKKADAKVPAGERKELRAIRQAELRGLQKAAATCMWRVTDSENALEMSRQSHELSVSHLGVCLLAVKVRMPHGAFKAWWQQIGMTQARVSYAMRVAFGKVKAAKEKREASPRAKALRDVGNLLAKLYDLGQRHAKTPADTTENRERMEKLCERIVGMIRQKFIAQNWPTPTRQPVKA